MSDEEKPAETAEQPDEPLAMPRRRNEESASSPPGEMLSGLEEESAHGLSLEAAIERLLAVNADLAAKFQDIPKARADVLTAGLRNNPVVLLTASPIPYGPFSVQRPGATVYDITVVQSLDLSGKHKTSKRVAELDIPVLEAHYQDAARLEMDRLYKIYVNVLEARAATRTARANVEYLAAAADKCREQIRRGRRSPSDQKRISIRQAGARIALQRAETALTHGLRNLSVLLALPPEEAEHLNLCGSLRDRAPPPPSTEKLIQIARQERPDLRALQLSVVRARAKVRQERAEAVDDFFLFFSPYQALDSTPQGLRVGNSWEIGLMIPLPSLNRNQGEIARARTNVVQWRSEVDRAEQEIIDEVRRAASEYTISRQVVEQYERDILVHGSRLREQKFRRFAEEEKDVGSFLSAQRGYDEMSRAYLDALARHRRAMLRINTAVGRRILP